MQYGKRIVFNPITGQPLNYSLEEMSGSLQDGLRPEKIDFIDLPFGDTTLNNVAIFHIDITTRKVVIDSMIPDPQPTYDELQQQLLQAKGVI